MLMKPEDADTSSLEPMNYRYQVSFELYGLLQREDFEAGNAGTAFALCLKAHPEAKLVKAIVEGISGAGWMEHLPPPVQRPPTKRTHAARALNKREKGCEFPFYDQVKVKERE